MIFKIEIPFGSALESACYKRTGKPMPILTTISARILLIACEISGAGLRALTSPSREFVETNAKRALRSDDVVRLKGYDDL